MSGSVPGRVLAIDYGQKRIGFAVSDELRLTVAPHSVFERASEDGDWAHILEMVDALSVREIVVGVPFRLDGSESASTARVRAWIRNLESKVEVPVHLHDEALTTWEAEERMKAMGLGPKERKKRVDAFAAACLLEEVLALRAPKSL